MANLETRQPSNPNFLQNVNFDFFLQRAPNLNWFTQKANLPSVGVSTTIQSGPFAAIKRHGQKMVFSEFQLTFKVDENFENYLELFNWMEAIGWPDDFTKYGPVANAPAGSGGGIWSDGSLLVYNSAKTVNLEFVFQNMFPISLTDLIFDRTQDGINFVSCTATFAYHRFTIRQL